MRRTGLKIARFFVYLLLYVCLVFFKTALSRFLNKDFVSAGAENAKTIAAQTI